MAMKHFGVAMKHVGESTFIYGQATSFVDRATIHAAPSTWHADRATSTSRQPQSIPQAGTWHGDDVKSDAAPAASTAPRTGCQTYNPCCRKRHPIRGMRAGESGFVNRSRRRDAHSRIQGEIYGTCVGAWICGDVKKTRMCGGRGV